MGFPRIVISALRGGGGKTLLSVGLAAAWRRAGKRVVPFKKGPDYIDAGWLADAAGQPCHNLDTFLMDPDRILLSFCRNAAAGDVALIEGNRGLHDGIDLEGGTSTAELAKLLDAPVLLCLDATKTTRTLAAVVLGLIRFDPEVRIRGVVLNRVAGARHEGIVRRSIEHFCGVPVLGAVPKLGRENFPERHMGLVPTPEHGQTEASVAAAADAARRYLDLERLLSVAGDAPALASPQPVEVFPAAVSGEAAPRIGIVRDSAFQFYYPENIEALRRAGAEIVFTSPLREPDLPELDALYIGGGFPETHAERLSQNRTYRETLARRAGEGMPVYAECGGLMYLGRSLVLGEAVYPMAGVLPAVYGLSTRPEGHGYTVAEVVGDSPFFPVGAEIRGHEFHYSRVLEWGGKAEDLVFRMKRGKGFVDRRDGVRFRNVLATYTHIHALGTPGWAQALVAAAAEFRTRRTGTTGGAPAAP